MPDNNLAKPKATEPTPDEQESLPTRIEWRGEPEEIADVVAFIRRRGFRSIPEGARAMLLGLARSREMQAAFDRLPMATFNPPANR